MERFSSASDIIRATGIGRDRLKRLTVAGVIPSYQPGGTGRILYRLSEVCAAIESPPRPQDAAARATAAATALLRQMRARTG
jgi:hypothetical protein